MGHPALYITFSIYLLVHLLHIISQEPYIIWSYTCIKWWYLEVFFSFFKILIFWVVRGLKVEKIAQNEKQQYIHHAPYFRNSIAYDHDFWDTCVEWYLQVLFSFFQNLIFGIFSEVKGQKMAQNDKKLCLLRFISEKPYILWLGFLVQMCKMMTSPDVFFIFSSFDFWSC